MSAQLTLIAHLFAKADKVEEARALLSSLVGTTRTEKGCIDYHLHQSTADPSEFVFYESWATREDLDRHMETPNLRNLASRSSELFRKEPTIDFMKMISEKD